MGGGIASMGSLSVSNCTLTQNTAGDAGGGIYVADTEEVPDGGDLPQLADAKLPPELWFGETVITNTIVAGNTASESPDVFGTYTETGSNIIGWDPAANGGMLLDEWLDPILGWNGGLTQTHALLPVSGSPAIDASGSGASTDQRGLPRPMGWTFDIGAYEVLAPSFSRPQSSWFDLDRDHRNFQIPEDEMELKEIVRDLIENGASYETILTAMNAFYAKYLIQNASEYFIP